MPIYTCPISYEEPRVPMITNEGITYDFISIARSLLRENAQHNPTANATLDPITHEPICTLIYNRAIKKLNDELLGKPTPLTDEEKNQIASLYTQLMTRFPTLKIHGIHQLEGMQVLIGELVATSQLVPHFNVVHGSLWDAVSNRDPMIVTALLANPQIDPNQIGAHGVTPLHMAILNRDLPVVTALLTNSRLNPNQTEGSGITPLRSATLIKNASIVRALLTDPRVDPNLSIPDGTTPLHSAVYNQDLPIVEALLADPRVNPNLQYDGMTALHVAVCEENLPIVEALLADPRVNPNLPVLGNMTALHLATDKRNLALVTILLADERINPNLASDSGVSPLLCAMMSGHIPIVCALLTHPQVDPHKAIADGTIAMQNTYPEFVHILLSDETIQDYYLNQLIKNSVRMRDGFIKNPIFFNELSTYRNALWARLSEPSHFNLPDDEYYALLTFISDSSREPNRTLHHPLYMLFETPRSWFPFFREENTILKEIQTYLDAKKDEAMIYSVQK